MLTAADLENLSTAQIAAMAAKLVSESGMTDAQLRALCVKRAKASKYAPVARQLGGLMAKTVLSAKAVR